MMTARAGATASTFTSANASLRLAPVGQHRASGTRHRLPHTLYRSLRCTIRVAADPAPRVSGLRTFRPLAQYGERREYGGDADRGRCRVRRLGALHGGN